jgi:hypothetical protein
VEARLLTPLLSVRRNLELVDLLRQIITQWQFE